MNTKVTDEMVEALRTIASQHLYAEMNDEAQMCADFEGGYDSLIAVARAALSSQDQEPVQVLAWRGVGSDGHSDVTQRQDIANQWIEDGLSVTPLSSLSSLSSLHPHLQGMETVPPVDHVATGRWLPIACADTTITDVQDFSEVGIMLRTSERYWVRDNDGRVFEACWSEGEDHSYWWDFEGESPVDPVEFMPHPLDPRFSAASEGSTDE